MKFQYVPGAKAAYFPLIFNTRKVLLIFFPIIERKSCLFSNISWYTKVCLIKFLKTLTCWHRSYSPGISSPPPKPEFLDSPLQESTWLNIKVWIRDCSEFLVGGGWGLAGGLGPPRNALAQGNPRDWFQSQAPPRFEPRPFSKRHPSPSRKTGCHTNWAN